MTTITEDNGRRWSLFTTLVLFINLTVSHHKDDIFHCLYSLQRIVADGDDVGTHSGFDGTASFFETESLSRICGKGLQDREIWNASAFPFVNAVDRQLATRPFVRVENYVRSPNERDACFVSTLDRIDKPTFVRLFVAAGACRSKRRRSR